MRQSGRKCFGIFIAVALLYIIVSGIVLALTKNSNPGEAAENAKWISTSKYWLDRQACAWIGVCGVMHLNSNGWTSSRPGGRLPISRPSDPYDEHWQSGPEDPDSWSPEERRLREIPHYVFDYAPYVHLFSGEQYWPGDLVEHLLHTAAQLNYTTVEETDEYRNISDLNLLNNLRHGNHGKYVYLESDQNVEELPVWLSGAQNIPVTPKQVIGEPEGPPETKPKHHTQLNTFPMLSGLEPSSSGKCGGNSGFGCVGSAYGDCCSIFGWCGDSRIYCQDFCDPLHGDCIDPLHPPLGPKEDLKRRHVRDFNTTTQKRDAGRSAAPAFLFTVDKGNGTLDAFWFFFYSYNQGQKVLGMRFGNHVGDWEHTMIRFQDGAPTSIFLSEHEFGAAYTWSAMEKYMPNPDGSETMLGSWGNHTIAQFAKRPVVYSAVGSHAMYATSGLHPYVLPLGLLHDQTDRGPLWDPALNVKSYTYDKDTMQIRSSTLNPKAPTEWFEFAGHWGDKYYPLSDQRQYRIAGQYHFVNGPTGPKFKNLLRKTICQSPGDCKVSEKLRGNVPMILPPYNGGEEGGLPGGNRTDDMA